MTVSGKSTETPLLRIIVEEIERLGPMEFRRFMELALYHPEHGYYSSGKVRIGAENADFVTAPHVTRLFGRCMARLVAMADRALGEPATFTLVEGGPGEGVLARDILDALAASEPGLYRRLVYVPEEVSPALAARQIKILAAHADKLGVIGADGFCGLHLSNELLDAMPVHWVRAVGGETSLVCADAGPEGLIRTTKGIEDEQVRLEAARIASLHPAQEFHFEINPAAAGWLASVAQRCTRGFIVTIDYGDLETRLFGPQRPEGSVRGFTEGGFAESLFERPGELDITASVNFSVLFEAAARLGLDTLALMSQRDLLFATGIATEIKREEARAADEAELMAVRQELWPLLFDGTGMGAAFKALIAGVGIEASALGLDPEGAVKGLQF